MLIEVTYVTTVSTLAYATTEVEVPDDLMGHDALIEVFLEDPSHSEHLTFEPNEHHIHRFDCSDPELEDWNILEDEDWNILEDEEDEQEEDDE